jgi:hypothetical protein
VVAEGSIPAEPPEGRRRIALADTDSGIRWRLSKLEGRRPRVVVRPGLSG